MQNRRCRWTKTCENLGLRRFHITHVQDIPLPEILAYVSLGDILFYSHPYLGYNKNKGWKTTVVSMEFLASGIWSEIFLRSPNLGGWGRCLIGLSKAALPWTSADSARCQLGMCRTNLRSALWCLGHSIPRGSCLDMLAALWDCFSCNAW